jgi:hypothetical protein
MHIAAGELPVLRCLVREGRQNQTMCCKQACIAVLVSTECRYAAFALG